MSHISRVGMKDNHRRSIFHELAHEHKPIARSCEHRQDDLKRDFLSGLHVDCSGYSP